MINNGWSQVVAQFLHGYPRLYEVARRLRNRVHRLRNRVQRISAYAVRSVVTDYSDLELTLDHKPQLLIDISQIHERPLTDCTDAGVQRVTRNHLSWLLGNSPAEITVKPVYSPGKNTYLYAERYCHLLAGKRAGFLTVDTPVHLRRNDIFLVLDLAQDVQIENGEFFKQLIATGAKLKFLIHDLLPIEFPNHFYDQDLASKHSKLMSLAVQSHGAICVSEATESSLHAWIKEHSIATHPDFSSTVVPNGVDSTPIENGRQPSQETIEAFSKLGKEPIFLMVSTIEPRKMHRQVIDAFRLLWQEGIEIGLVIVGQDGWDSAGVVAEIRELHKSSKPLIWLGRVDDRSLRYCYQNSSCLIAASENEGFGLSLIEAGQYSLPIIARDIPVFREVASNHASFFLGTSANELAAHIKKWLVLRENNQHPNTKGFKVLSWQESSALLLKKVLS